MLISSSGFGFAIKEFSSEETNQLIALAIPGFDLTTRDLYFKIQVEVFTNHILAENTYLLNHRNCTEHKNMVLKPSKKDQII